MTKYEEFKKNGYVVIKNALSEDEVQNLRKVAIRLCDQKAKEVGPQGFNGAQDRQLYAKAFTENPELINPLYKKKIVDGVKEVLGDDFVSFADFSLQDNCHSPVWHVDAQSLGLSSQYIYEDSFNVAKLGLYLQRDDDIYGGQLDIIPGSHLPSFLGTTTPIETKKRFGKISRLQFLAIKIRNMFLKKTSVNVAAGDVLLFHSLLWHRASQPKWNTLEQIDAYGIKNPPLDKRKFMLQWEISENNEFAEVYSVHQTKKGEAAGSGQFFEANQYDFDDYHETTIELIKENNVNFVKYLDLSVSAETNNLRSKKGTPIVFSE